MVEFWITLQYRPMVQISESSIPHQQFADRAVVPSERIQNCLKTVLEHLLSELLQKNPEVDVQVVDPQMQSVLLTICPVLNPQSDNSKMLHQLSST